MAEDWNAANWLGRLKPGLGSGTLTQDQRDAKYAAYVESTANVVDGWWTDPEKVAATATRLGLDAGAPVDDVRKTLFLKRYPV